MGSFYIYLILAAKFWKHKINLLLIVSFMYLYRICYHRNKNVPKFLGFDIENLKPPVWVGGETEALTRLERHLERKVRQNFPSILLHMCSDYTKICYFSNF